MAQQSVCAHCGFRNGGAAHFCARCEEPLQAPQAGPAPVPRAPDGTVKPEGHTRVAPWPAPGPRTPASALPTAPWPTGSPGAVPQGQPHGPEDPLDRSERTEVSYAPQRRAPRPAPVPAPASRAAPEAAAPKREPTPKAEDPDRYDRTEVSYRPQLRAPAEAPTVRPPALASTSLPTAVLDENDVRQHWDAPLGGHPDADEAAARRTTQRDPLAYRAAEAEPAAPVPRQAEAHQKTQVARPLEAVQPAEPADATRPAEQDAPFQATQVGRIARAARAAKDVAAKAAARVEAAVSAAAAPKAGLAGPSVDVPTGDAPSAWMPAGRARASLALGIDAAVPLLAMAAATAAEMALVHGGWPSERATGLEAVAWWLYVYHRSVRRIVAVGLLVTALHLGLGIRTGRTLGRLLLGLSLAGPEGGRQAGRLPWSCLAWHLVGGALCLLSAGAGVYWMVVDPRGRTWANLLSRTVVVRNRPGEAA